MAHVKAKPLSDIKIEAQRAYAEASQHPATIDSLRARVQELEATLFLT